MKRSVLKWLLGISIGALVLLVLFTFGSWVQFNIAGAILLAMMGNTKMNAVPFADYMANFVGSPLFYIFMADLVVLVSSIVALIMTRKHM